MSNSPYYYQPTDSKGRKSSGGGRSSGGGGGGSGGGKILKIILIVMGILGFLCVGGGIAGYFVIQNLVTQGLTMLAKGAVESSAEAKEAIGEVQTVSINLEASKQRASEGAVFDIRGSKSNAVMVLDQESKSGQLELSDGRKIPLVLETR